MRPPQFALVLVGLLLLWPAAVNGGPFLFPDTTAYVRGADAAFLKATGHATAWSNEHVVRIARPAGLPTITPSSEGPPVAKPVLLGRSIFYGVRPFAGVLAGLLWVTILFQALIGGR